MKCGGFFVHTMKHCYATALYYTQQALSVTHARISLPHACNQERSIQKECIKMADYRALVSMGTP